MTSPNNPFVGSQAQRWLARQRAGYAPAPPSPPPPGTGALPTITPNMFVGSQTQRLLSRLRGPRYWPVDSPPSYIAPIPQPSGASGGLCIRGNYGFIGITAGAPDGTYWRMTQFTYQTDSQFIAAVLGDEGGNQLTPTVLYFHCDTGFTQGAFLSITYTGFTLGSFTRTGSTIKYQPFNDGSVSMLLLSAQTVGVQNIGNAYTVLVNSQPMLEFTGGSVAMGSNFRSGAISESRLTDGNGFIWDSFRVAALSLADYVQPVYTGSGCRLSRHAGTSAAQPHTVASTPAPFVGGIFDTIDIATADLLPNLLTNEVTVTRKGWYHVEARLQDSNTFGIGGAGNSCILELVLYKNGAVARMGQVIVAPSDTAIFSMWGAFDIDLVPDDVIKLGINIESADLGTWGVTVGSIAGFPAGSLSYMTVTLNNAAA